jgi:hypothetical protein
MKISAQSASHLLSMGTMLLVSKTSCPPVVQDTE